MTAENMGEVKKIIDSIFASKKKKVNEKAFKLILKQEVNWLRFG